LISLSEPALQSRFFVDTDPCRYRSNAVLILCSDFSYGFGISRMAVKSGRCFSLYGKFFSNKKEKIEENSVFFV